jgi:N-acetylglutamate synthase-like GNAT family acetyltransferase
LQPCDTPVAGVRPGIVVSLRKAELEDVPAIERLVRRAVLEVAIEEYPHQLLDEALNRPMAVDTELITDGTYFVAMAGEGSDARMAGVGGWSRRGTMHEGVRFSGRDVPDATEAQSPPASENGTAAIRAFYVDPDYQRRGVAALLLSRCLAEACNSGFRRAELVATLTGEKLYARAGFQTEERLEAILPSGHAFPVVRMTRALK